jgi:hypothetical protein
VDSNRVIILSEFAIPNELKSNWNFLSGILLLLARDYFLHQQVATHLHPLMLVEPQAQGI